jgi:5,10-methylene-tetrahydrofolate dehydrogenase/methenyl tetrahydrofolate cyclohydrolase
VLIASAAFTSEYRTQDSFRIFQYPETIPSLHTSKGLWTHSVKLSVLFLLLLMRPFSLQGFSTGNNVNLRHRRRYDDNYCKTVVYTPLFATTTTTTTKATTTAANEEKIIDGKAIAANIRQELKEDILKWTEAGKPTPGLAVVLVGSRRDSQTYVNMKKKACAQVGIASFGYDYDESSVTQEELLSKIAELYERTDVHGILVQLPLPSHLDESTAKLARQGTHGNKEGFWSEDLSSIPFSVPCTPLGCLELLDRSGVEIAGKNAVVVGRSNLVGLPVSFLLLHRDATVTIVHSKTKNIEEQVSRGDIVIAAVGKANLVKSSWLKKGAVVIDVGINSVDLPPEQIKEGKKSYKLVGDVDFDSAIDKCSKITPVPGGVGPMTIAMLLRNTVNACKRASADN